MDGMNLMAISFPDGQNLIQRSALKWARMEFEIDKSHCVKKGLCINANPFYIGEVESEPALPSLQQKAVIFLGRVINGSLNDRKSTDELETELRSGISLLDKSAHSGLNKVWILLYLLIFCIRWPLMIHEIPIYKVKNLEKIVSKHIGEWL